MRYRYFYYSLITRVIILFTMRWFCLSRRLLPTNGSRDAFCLEWSPKLDFLILYDLSLSRNRLKMEVK